MQDKIKNHTLTKIFTPAVLILFGPAFVLMTNPDELPLPFVIVPFIWLFVLLFYATTKLLKFRTRANKRQVQSISILIATMPVLLLVFQSIHQLSIRDILLSLGIVSLAAIYMLRADFIK